MRSAAADGAAGSMVGGGGNVIRIHLCDSDSLYTRKDFVREPVARASRSIRQERRRAADERDEGAAPQSQDWASERSSSG
jgi:hypothetical protein